MVARVVNNNIWLLGIVSSFKAEQYGPRIFDIEQELRKLRPFKASHRVTMYMERTLKLYKALV